MCAVMVLSPSIKHDFCNDLTDTSDKDIQCNVKASSIDTRSVYVNEALAGLGAESHKDAMSFICSSVCCLRYLAQV